MPALTQDPAARLQALADLVLAIADHQNDTPALISRYAGQIEQTVAAMQDAGNPFGMISAYEQAAAQLAGQLVSDSLIRQRPMDPSAEDAKPAG